MEELKVELGARSYPIYIGAGLLHSAELLNRHVEQSSVMVVSNDVVAPLYMQQIVDGLHSQVSTEVLPDGERYKTLESLNRVITSLLDQRCDRNTTLIALGGGVVGDITGFAAACYQRGIKFVQLPTTLLAQVDSSVGGKTGVNHPAGKNMIGAFHQPQAVLIDTDTLRTLEDRELSAGLAEVIKYGLINDPEFFDWLEANMTALLQRDPDCLAFAIRRSCENKAAIVAADEREKTGARALLNLGHTFGHAIEAGMGYGVWLHGEAVGCGMLMAARMSHVMGWLDEDAVLRIERLLQQAKLPVHAPPQIQTDRFLDLMSVDKKVTDGRMQLILLRGIGKAVMTDDFDPKVLRNTLTRAAA